MGKIFVTTRSAVFGGDPYQHTNLVYDADGNPVQNKKNLDLWRGEN
jgi:hypothetical protein